MLMNYPVPTSLPKVPKYLCASDTTSSESSRSHDLLINLREVWDPRFPNIFTLHNHLISSSYAFQDLKQIRQLLFHRLFASIDHIRNFVSVE